MNNEQRLIELAHELPEPILAEGLDFAEYLQPSRVQLLFVAHAGRSSDRPQPVLRLQ